MKTIIAKLKLKLIELAELLNSPATEIEVPLKSDINPEDKYTISVTAHTHERNGIIHTRRTF